MSSKHTPFPWNSGGIFHPDSDRPSVNIWGPTPEGMQSGEIVAKDVRLPNARVILAAADLLAACKLQEKADHFHDNCDHCIDIGGEPAACETCWPYFEEAMYARRAAIKRAEGAA